MRILFSIIFICFFSNVNAAEEETTLQNQSQANTIEVEQLSDQELLNKAKSLRRKNPTKSFKLANQVLDLSLQNNNPSITAQVQTLLGKLAKKAKNNEQALAHFLQASVIHKSVNNTHDQIVASVDYINLLLSEKYYQQADDSIVKLLSIAQQYKKSWPLALTLILKADSYYLQKDYKSAIEQYTEAVKHLSNHDKTTQKKLAETYKKLAQSYKRIKDREQTAEFYKKALNVFTTLKDKKNMARTLNTLAEAERYLGHLLIALDYSTRGLEIHKNINDPEGYAKASMGAGIIYRQISRYEKSLENLYQAYLYYKEVNDINGIAEASNQLGFIYTRLEQFEQARSFYQLSIDMPTNKIKQKTLASALREMAVIHVDAGDYEQAMTMVQRAYKIYKKQNDILKSSTTARVIANIYRDQKDEKNAIYYYRESLSLAKNSGNTTSQIRAMIPLAGVLIDIDVEESAGLLETCLVLSIQEKNKSFMLYTYTKLRKVEKVRRNFSKSLHYAEEELKLTKIIQKEKDDNELLLIKAKLYSHTREIELASLREKTKLDQLELAKKNNEIEIAEKTRIITELELTKNKYATIALALLLSLSVLMVVFIFRLFIASTKRNKELDYLAARDPLTGCYNRRALFDHMYQDFEKSELLNEYCIIMVDIDHFKDVNDTYGHSVGDSVICGVADILQACVGDKDIVSRFGGEEFCIYLNQSSEVDALDLAETMRHLIERHLFENISITCCFGVSSIKFNAKSYLELINQADFALYQSKSLGRNKVTMWDREAEKELP